MFALVVRFDLRDADAARAFDALITETLPQIEQHEPDTLIYAVHTVVGEPLARVFYETYTDADGHAQHEQMPHTARFLSEMQQYLTGTRVEFLNPELLTSAVS